MFFFGAGWAITFDVGVRLYLAEVISIIGLLFVNWTSSFTRHPMARQIVGSYVLWVVAIVIADGVNEVALFDSARNAATPIIGACSLLFVLAVLSRNPNALLSFLTASVIAKGVLGEASYGDTFAELSFSFDTVTQNTNYFKVRIDPFLTPALLLVACLLARKSLLYAGAVFFAASVAYLALDARSSGGMFFLSALALVAVHFRFRPKFGSIVAVGAIAAVVGYVAHVGYVNYTFTHNPDGHNGRQLARMENPYNPVELLLMGRSEWQVMTTAIAERPIFGWGSWAIDTGYRFAYLRADRTGEVNFGGYVTSVTGDYIPVHSVVGSAWVWSGLLGFIALAWLFRSVLVMSRWLPYVRSSLAPASIFMTLFLSWHFFFSPPQHVRLSFPITLATLLVLTREAYVYRRLGPRPSAVRSRARQQA